MNDPYTTATDERSLYNSRIADLFLQWIKVNYPHIDIDRLLDDVGIQPYEVDDPGHWFSQDHLDRLVERLVQLTGNEKLARDVGRYVGSPDALGSMRQHVLGLISPAKAFGLISKVTRNFTRSVAFQTTVLGPSEVEVLVKPLNGIVEKPYHCENRLGFLQSITARLNIDTPKISHPECACHGDAACRYLISWKERRSAVWGRIRGFAMPAFVALNLIGLLVAPAFVMVWLLPGSTLAWLALALWVDTLEKRDLRSSEKKLLESTENLIDQLNINYNNGQLAAEIGQVISNKADVDGVLASVSRILQERLEFDRGAILLVDEECRRLRIRSAFGYADSEQEQQVELQLDVDPCRASGLLAKAFHERKPLLISDVAEVKDRLGSEISALLEQLGTRSFISCPIACDGEAIGLLVVDNVRSNRPLLKSDLALLMGITPVIGISIQNARLLKQRSQQFNSILQVLSASIDARDFLTAGHSEKVTKYSVGICGELGLSAEETEVIRIAAMLHDYGKIGVPDFILKKDGKLTDEERALVQTHPSKTREILEQISFEGIYMQIPRIAGSHHEKIDGSGYPYGLKGKEIPLGARILAVADFFEAITAKRHYRGPMRVGKALELLKEGSGTHFDPRIVGALINYVTQNPDFLQEEDEAKARFFHRHVRVPFRSQVSCKVARRTIGGASSNLSAGGLFVAAGEEVKPGDLLDLVFTLPKFPGRLIKAQARVAWINPSSKVSPLPVGFGVQFVKLKEEDSIEVRDFVNQVYAAA